MFSSFDGLCTALITPFSKDKIDYESLEKIIEFQIDNKVDSILLCGSTGERFSLSDEEYLDLSEFFIKKVKNRIHTILGTGSNDFRESLEKTKLAQKLGFHSSLLVSPYYNKPNQRGILKHFESIADRVNIPCFLYNVPSRTASNISVEVIAKLADHPNILGIKQAYENFGDLVEIFKLVQNKNFKVYSGDDVQSFYFFPMGAKGLISVASNIIPKKMKLWISYLQKNDMTKAKEFLIEHYSFMKALFCDTNPVPIKEVLSWKGLCKNEYRLPLIELEDNLKFFLKEKAKDII